MSAERFKPHDSMNPMERLESNRGNATRSLAKRGAIKNLRRVAAVLIRCALLSVMTVGCASLKAVVGDPAGRGPKSERPPAVQELTQAKPPVALIQDTPRPRRAVFEREAKSADVERVANWVVDSGDNRGMPFVIVDKVDAKVFVFHADGRLRGAAPALLGLARGDDTVPGIGDRKLSDIRPEERTTPAGRFVAALGLNFSGKEILWVDYDIALSLHRVVTSNPTERRLERLATPTPLDNRISFGCINVPEEFFNHVVKPSFSGTYGVVYVLPEIRSCSDIFASFYEID